MEKLNSIKKRIGSWFSKLFSNKKSVNYPVISQKTVTPPEPEHVNNFGHYRVGSNNCRKRTKGRIIQKIDMPNGTYKFIHHPIK